MAAAGDDLYLVLGIDRKADAAEILDAYRRLIRQSTQMAAAGGGRGGTWLSRVEHAYEVLSDPRRRAEYDGTLGPVTRTCPLCGLPVADGTDHHDACVEPEGRSESRPEERRRFWNEIARWAGLGG